MIFLDESQIVATQTRKKEKAMRDLFVFLDAMEDFVIHLFPDSNVDAPAENNLEVNRLFTSKVNKTKQWLKKVYDLSIQVYTVSEIDELLQFDEINLPEKMAIRVINDLLGVFSNRMHLSENEILFISEVGNALPLPVEDIDSLIEKSMYQIRRDFTESIKKHLNEKQRYWVALMLWKAVHADNKIHPKEYKYFENIAQILSYNLKTLNKLENEPNDFSALPSPQLDDRFYRHIFRYIVEIVMIDGQFDPNESKFVQEMGSIFGFNKQQQDQVIQPVASALMLRQSLFG